MSWEPPVLDAALLTTGKHKGRWAVTRELPDGAVLTEIVDQPPETHEMRLGRLAFEAETKLRRVVNARTLKRQATSQALIQDAIRLRRAGATIVYIARKLDRSPRWVSLHLPADLKGRRNFG